MEIKRGEIFLADLSGGIGSEQVGERPVLIVQNDKGNKYSPTVTVLPITSKVHKSKGIPTHVIVRGIPGLEKNSAVMAEQITTIDKGRLKKKIGIMPNALMVIQITKAIKIQLGIMGRKR